jgi:hypothetical protein
MGAAPREENPMTTPDELPTPEDRPTPNDRAKAIEERAQALGREAEVAANRFAANPAVRDAADMAGRVWGLVLLAAGLWLFAAITLRLSLPRFAWGDFWPLILIVIGGLILVRGLARGR